MQQKIIKHLMEVDTSYDNIVGVLFHHISFTAAAFIKYVEILTKPK
jgi:hypothetical protein